MDGLLYVFHQVNTPASAVENGTFLPQLCIEPGRSTLGAQTPTHKRSIVRTYLLTTAFW